MNHRLSSAAIGAALLLSACTDDEPALQPERPVAPSLVLVAPSSGATLPAGQVVVSGVAAAAAPATLALQFDGGAARAVPVEAGGDFALAIDVAEGAHEIRLVLRDAFAREAVAEAAFTVLPPEPAAPSLTLAGPVDGSVLPFGPVAYWGTVEVAAAPGALTLAVDGGDAAIVEIDAAGSFAGEVQLPAGAHTLRFVLVGALDRSVEQTVAVQVLEAWRGPEAGEDQPGGDTTVNEAGALAFSRPLANLPTERLASFSIGDTFFDAEWFPAPHPRDDRDGLGPLFHADSCLACHVGNGRGAAPFDGADAPASLLFRISQPDGSPHPTYGDQLQPRGIAGVAGEARVRITYEEIAGTYADGTQWLIRKPTYDVYAEAYGSLGEVQLSPRIAQQMIGLGLLAAVPDELLLAAADPSDADGDGISGRPNLVTRVRDGAEVIGRFGWKANQPDLPQQNAAALNGDLGITSPIFAEENCGGIPGCAEIPHGGAPEFDRARADALDFYTAALAVPARRDFDDTEVLAGKARFHEGGCASCHTPSLVTGDDAPLRELAGQRIWPYTDLLLHDMGEGLADGRADGIADGREWRTPPLWGLGLTAVVGPQAHFLHDGRARTIEEAILWHGGEAQAARDAFVAMPADARAALLRFVESL